MKIFPALTATFALALTASAPPALAQTSTAPSVSAWEIGPIIRGRNYSVNMPLRMTQTRDGAAFDFPVVPEDYGHVHYVTYNPGSLRGAKSITIRYRIDAAPGTRFVPQESPHEQATLSLMFQRAGDKWTAKGPYTHYRWFAPENTVVPLMPGTREVTVPLNGNWSSVYGAKASAQSDAFDAALAQTQRLGFLFGSSSGRGHGVYATAPARFTLLDFRVN